MIPSRTSFINTSILVTLLMCYHRYRSISDPLEYHSEQLTTNKGYWVLKATFCCLFLGWAANLPHFFETQIVFNTHEYWCGTQNNDNYHICFKQPFVSYETYENGTSYYVSRSSNIHASIQKYWLN